MEQREMQLKFIGKNPQILAEMGHIKIEPNSTFECSPQLATKIFEIYVGLFVEYIPEIKAEENKSLQRWSKKNGS